MLYSIEDLCGTQGPPRLVADTPHEQKRRAPALLPGVCNPQHCAAQPLGGKPRTPWYLLLLPRRRCTAMLLPPRRTRARPSPSSWRRGAPAWIPRPLSWTRGRRWGLGHATGREQRIHFHFRRATPMPRARFCFESACMNARTAIDRFKLGPGSAQAGRFARCSAARCFAARSHGTGQARHPACMARMWSSLASPCSIALVLATRGYCVAAALI